MKSILDPRFKYSHSSKTDIRKTFARVRKQMKLLEGPEKPQGCVVPIRKEAGK